MTRGYLNRPELAAARFSDRNFGNYSIRLYQTGDLGRYLPNGELEYLGRIDEQVKVRGFRIELGEIEAVLHQHPAIEEAVVLMRETESVGDIQPDAGVTELRQFIKQNKSENFSDRQLVAYCVSSQQPAPTITELRRWLKNQLPEYMIPTAFIMLDSLPLTPSGKVDKRALPNPDRIRPELDTAYIAPTTSAEKALAQIWTQVLRIERVGIHDNFFELGGDSIRSIQVLAKSQEIGLNFSLQQLFQHQTIYELAQEVNITEPSSLLSRKTEKFSLIAASDRQKTEKFSLIAASDRQKSLAKIAQVPVKHVLLAAHIRVMSLLSGETDVLTGLESNGRLETEDGEQTLGIHLNTVPLRLQLHRGTWIDLIQQTFQAESELLPYRRYPYAELKKLNRGGQLFETVFNYTHFHIFQNLQSLTGLEIIGAQGFGETHFALRVEFNREPFSDNIQLDLECDLTKINQVQLEAIGGYYFETLTAMSQQPSDRYESQCLLPVNEQHQLLIWNDTSREYPESLLIHQWFVNQALQTPDATAEFIPYFSKSLLFKLLFA
ncbi:hypothetical protein NIES592_01045 [Fischerella major NIES-592]|uniref:Carrier domain-containing protein n=1 Tax=Fischerella major NIES-592 TaxID=210994 RepID=A0A1U7H4P7_9CYAN|nr:hypothetical protein NIES592_01045 [Fischerella major NIES-592]